MSHFDLRRFKAIPDLPSRICFFYTLAAFDYSFSHVNLIIYPPTKPPPPLFSKLRESTQGIAVLIRGQVDDGVRVTLRFLSKVEVFNFFRSWFKRSKKEFNVHNEYLKITES